MAYVSDATALPPQQSRLQTYDKPYSYALSSESSTADDGGGTQSQSHGPDRCQDQDQIYVLDWDAATPCTRRPITISRPASSSGLKTTSTPALKITLPPVPETASKLAFHLAVIRPTGDDDLDRAVCREFDVDPAVLAAHSAGQRYRPAEPDWRKKCHSGLYTAASYAFPQVLGLSVAETSPPAASAPSTAAAAEAGPPSPRRSQGEKEREAEARPPNTARSTRDCSVAVFCRVSLWTGPRAAVLFLDPSPSSTALEDALLPALDDTAAVLSAAAANETAVATLLHHIVPALVRDQWTDFFDSLGVRRTCANRKLYWDMAQYLEQNLVATRIHEKGNRRQQQQQQHQRTPLDAALDLDEVTPGDWMDFLSRLGRIVALLPLVHGQKGHDAKHAARDAGRPRTATSIAARSTNGPDGRLLFDSAGLSTALPPFTAPPIMPPQGPVGFSATSESQESLSRVTYMGGILLPFSIVAGIMSMSDPYGPGNPLFWVFWAVAVPLTILVLLVIYADQIAKMDVWKPMDHQSFQEALRRGETAAVNAFESAAGTVMDRLGGASAAVAAAPALDVDPEIETAPVTSAVRVDRYDGSSRHRHSVRRRVRLTADAGPDRPTYYRLSDPPEPPSTPDPVFNPEIRPIRMTQFIEPEDRLAMAHVASSSKGRRLWDHIAGRRRRQSLLPQTAPGPPLQFVSPATATVRPASVNTGVPPEGVAGPLAYGLEYGGGGGGVDPPPPAAAMAAATGAPRIFVQQQPDGTLATAWQRQKLGWAGAVKRIVGYETLHRA